MGEKSKLLNFLLSISSPTRVITFFTCMQFSGKDQPSCMLNSCEPHPLFHLFMMDFKVNLSNITSFIKSPNAGSLFRCITTKNIKISHRSGPDRNLDNKELTARVFSESQPQRRCIEWCTYWRRTEGTGGGEAAGWGRGQKTEINGCGCGCVGNQQASRRASDPGEQQKQGLAVGVSASATERLQQRY